MGRNKTMHKAIAIAFVSLLFLAGVAGYYVYHIRNRLIDHLKDSVLETASTTTSSVRLKINGYMSTLENISYVVGEENSDDLEVLVDKLGPFIDNSLFLNYGIADTDGSCLTTKGDWLDISHREYFQQALNGETSFSNTLLDSNGNYINVFAVPVYNDKEVSQVLCAIIKAEKLADFIFMDVYNGKGFVTLGDTDGNIVIKSNSEHADSSITNLNQLTFMDDFQIENLQNEKEGIAKFVGLHDEERYIAYEPLGLNNWYVFTIVPVSVINSKINDVIFIALITWLIVAFILSFIIGYLYISKKRTERKINQLIFYDDLTQHYNFNKFRIYVQTMLDKNHSDTYALLEFDVSDFKLLNEIYGYQGGNQLLIKIMKICEDDCHCDECCARVNADRFILLWKMHDKNRIVERFESLIEKIQQTITNINDFKFTFFAGVYLIKKDDHEFTPCYDRCIHAKMLGKKKKKDKCTFFNEGMYQMMLDEKRLENHMEKALEDHEFKVFLQPKVNLHDDVIYGAEALVRWNSSVFGKIMPNKFIPLFEKNGFIEQLDMFVLDEVCKLLYRWKDTYPSLCISFNVSRAYIFRAGFAKRVLDIVKRNHVDPKKLEIEITESVIFDSSADLYRVLEELHSYGFRISMDDFGSGYSSLNMLKDIPIDTIKLDQAFFHTNEENIMKAREIVGGVLDLAKRLGIHSVAEGIEEKEEILFLKEHDCDEVQGYYYSPPICEEEFEKFMNTYKK